MSDVTLFKIDCNRTDLLKKCPLIQKKNILIFFPILLLFLFSSIAHATACTTFFPDGIAGAGGHSDIEFNNCSVRIYDSPDNILSSDEVDFNGCNSVCNGSACHQGPETPTLPSPGSFQYSSSSQDLDFSSGSHTVGSGGVTQYDKITVDHSDQVTFLSQSPTTVYKIDKLEIKNSGLVYLAPGAYWINDLEISNSGRLLINGSGKVQIYVNDFEVKNSASVNYINSSTHRSGDFFVYSYGKVNMDNSAHADMILYAKDEIELKNSVQFRGALSSEDKIELSNSVDIYYEGTQVNQVQTNGLCDAGGSAIHHFKINHDATGLFCIPEVITVTAKDSSNQTITNYTGTVTLDTASGKGSWTLNTGNGAFSDPTLNDGLAQYTFNASDQGVAAFNLDYKNGALTIDIEVYDQSSPSTLRDDDTEGTLSFAPQGFVLTNSAIPSSPSGTPASFSDNQTAGNNFTTPIHITAYGQLPFGACGVIESYAGNKNLKYWMDYVNPNSGQGKVMTVNGSNVGTSSGSPSTITTSFTLGRAQVTGKYSDAGRIRLNVKDDTTGPTIFSGATSPFVVKPAQLDVTVVGNPNPVATGPTSTIFRKAGENFTVNVKAKDSAGNITPNFGRESPAEGLQISSNQLVDPVGGTNGVINGSFTKIGSGEFEGAAFNFTEVGIIKIKVEMDGQDYLGAGNVSTITNNVGRFTPYRLTMTSNSVPKFNASCPTGGFSYLAQNFLYQTRPQVIITAQEKNGGITTNYSGTYWKLLPSGVTLLYSSNSGTFHVSATDLISAVLAQSDVTGLPGATGTATVTLGDGGGIRFNKATGENVQNFNAEIKLDVSLQDSDAILGDVSGINLLTFGGTTPSTGIGFLGSSADAVYNKIFQGRIRMGNANGSELMSLNIPFTVQYFNGSDYTTNPFDSCTVFNNQAHVVITHTNPGSLDAFTKQVTTFSQGVGNITLSAPSSAGNHVPAEVDLESNLSQSTGANLEYLQHDWPNGDANGLFDDNPSCRATFGIFGGEDNVIYLKEIF